MLEVSLGLNLSLLLSLNLLHLTLEVSTQIPSTFGAVPACRVVHDLLGRAFVDLRLECDPDHLLVLSLLLTLLLPFLSPPLYLLRLGVQLLKSWLLLLSFSQVAATVLEDLLSPLGEKGLECEISLGWLEVVGLLALDLLVVSFQEVLHARLVLFERFGVELLGWGGCGRSSGLRALVDRYPIAHRLFDDISSPHAKLRDSWLSLDPSLMLDDPRLLVH